MGVLEGFRACKGFGGLRLPGVLGFCWFEAFEFQGVWWFEDLGFKILGRLGGWGIVEIPDTESRAS